MTTPTAGTANGGSDEGLAPHLQRPRDRFLTIVPLVWAVVLLFHGAPDGAA